MSALSSAVYFLPPFVLYKLLIQGNPYFKFRILLLPPLSGQTGMSRAYLENGLQ